MAALARRMPAARAALARDSMDEPPRTSLPSAWATSGRTSMKASITWSLVSVSRLTTLSPARRREAVIPLRT